MFFDFATPFVARRLPARGRIFLEKPLLMNLNKNSPTFMGTVDSLLFSQHPTLVAVHSQISPVHTIHFPSYLRSTLMCVRKFRKATISFFVSVCPPTFPSARNISVFAEKTFMNFDIFNFFFENM
jgi:hypothetical protein